MVDKNNGVVNVTQPLVYTPGDLVSLLRRGRSAVYDDLKRGRIRSIRLGGRILIPADAVRELLAGGSTTDVGSADQGNR